MMDYIRTLYEKMLKQKKKKNSNNKKKQKETNSPIKVSMESAGALGILKM